jgi:serine/threonine protein kinase
VTDYPDLTGTRLGNYRLVRLLGRGRMGVVYLAQDEALLRPTAVKLLSWSFLEAQGERPEAWFLAEARSVARINHPAVVQVYNVAKHGNYCYIAMEYVEGVSGDALVARDGHLSPIDATLVVLQIAGALHQAHSCNIIHRDIKPGNVLIKPDGTAKLGDFGMALHSSSAKTGTPAPVGTPHYIAPEIWQGAPAKSSSDIYALGATYYYLLTGRPPFDTADLRTLINSHIQSPIPDPRTIVPTVPAECLSILQKCLAKLPGERFSSAQELTWELRGLLRRLDGRTPPPMAPIVVRRKRADSAEFEPEYEQPTTKAIEPWVSDLGLAIRPFSPVDAHRIPYQGEPQRSVRERLSALVRDMPGNTVVLTGERGSGRTVLARQCQTEVASTTPISFLDLKYGAHPLKAKRTLPQWACRALGALPSAASVHDAYLEGLIEHLAASPQPAILVLDAVPDEPSFVDKISMMVRAAYSTKCMTLIVIAGPDFASRLAATSGVESKAISTLTLPALDSQQTASYLAAWLEAARYPTAPPLIMTADAAMLACHRAKGNLVRTNNLATNMLRLAAIDKRRVIPSWYAWVASLDENWSFDADFDLHKPHGWPPKDILEILNAWREKSGIAQRRNDET